MQMQILTVGSSRKRRAGSVTSSVPMLTRFRSPPETPRTRGAANEGVLHLGEAELLDDTVDARHFAGVGHGAGEAERGGVRNLLAHSEFCKHVVVLQNVGGNLAELGVIARLAVDQHGAGRLGALARCDAAGEEVEQRRLPAPDEPMTASICPDRTSPLMLRRMTFSRSPSSDFGSVFAVPCFFIGNENVRSFHARSTGGVTYLDVLFEARSAYETSSVCGV